MHNLNPNRLNSGSLPTGPASSSPVLWFYGVEEKPIHGAGNCPICGNFLSGSYYRVNGQTACAVCAIQAHARETGKVSFGRALLLAVGVAIVCLTLLLLGWQHPVQDSVALCILIVGARFAWQIIASRRLHLDGPHKAVGRP
jgi:hypothetical protein